MAMSATEFSLLDDETLVEQATNGNRAALEALLERHAAAAASVAYAILHNRDDALDAAQIALLTIANEIVSGWKGQPFKACLYTYSHSAAVKLLIQNASRRRRERAVAGQAGDQEPDMVANRLEREEQLAALREELAGLSEDTAIVLELHHLGGLSVAEVAAQTGLSEGACKKRLSRGRELLRERLERRGIALAGIAFLIGLMDDLFGSAKAFAAELDSNAISKLAKVAATSALADNVIVNSCGELANISQSSAMAVKSGEIHVSDAGSAGPAQRSSSMSRTILVGTGAFALLALMWGLKFKNTDALTVANRPAITTEPLPRIANVQSGVKTEPPIPVQNQLPDIASRGTPQWQTPRFCQSNLVPMAISAHGQQVALVVADFQQSTSQLFCSADCGQTWSECESLKGYLIGNVAFDNAENCFIAGLPGDVQLRKPAMKVDWLVRMKIGGIGSPSTIWTAQEGEGFSCRPKIINTRDGNWLFACRSSESGHGQLQSQSLDVAFGRGLETPKELSTPWKREGMGITTDIAAWATDATHAGFVVTEDKALQHYSTSNGGKSWQRSEIRFIPDTESGSVVEMLLPMGMAQQNSRLVLSLQAMCCVPETRSTFIQYYMLKSDDLGKSWKDPLVFSSRVEPKPPFVFAGSTLHLMGSKIGVCHNVFEDMKAKPHGGGRMLFTDDDGRSWYDQHALEEFNSARLVTVIGGDKDSLHMATGILFSEAGAKEQEPYIVIRSFCAGTWNASKEPRPKWFKEKKLPEPTREEF